MRGLRTICEYDDEIKLIDEILDNCKEYIETNGITTNYIMLKYLHEELMKEKMKEKMKLIAGLYYE